LVFVFICGIILNIKVTEKVKTIYVKPRNYNKYNIYNIYRCFNKNNKIKILNILNYSKSKKFLNSFK